MNLFMMTMTMKAEKTNMMMKKARVRWPTATLNQVRTKVINKIYRKQMFKALALNQVLRMI